MSYLFRPTPVVTLGDGAYSSRNTLARLPGTSMQGIPEGGGALGKAGPTGHASRMRRVVTNFQPWLLTSGSMHGFLPNGLGADDGSDIIDWSGVGDIAPNLPEPSPIMDIPAPDLGLPAFQPTIPIMISPMSGPLPPAPLPGAGPTGTGIPGTQPVNTTTMAMQQGSSALNTILNFFKPSPAVPAGYKSLPGYGGGAAIAPNSYVAGAGASWFTQKTIIPQIPNWGVVAIGVVAVLALSGGGYAAGRSR